MDPDARQECLQRQLAVQIERFDRESSRHKRMYRRCRHLVFGLTACSTALAGLALALPAHQATINIAVVLATTAIGVVTSIEGLRKPAELWIHERKTFAMLKDLERDLQYRLAAGCDAAALDILFDRMQAVLATAGDQWSREIAGRMATAGQAAQAARAR